jgi:hypothetical protein
MLPIGDVAAVDRGPSAAAAATSAAQRLRQFAPLAANPVEIPFFSGLLPAVRLAAVRRALYDLRPAGILPWGRVEVGRRLASRGSFLDTLRAPGSANFLRPCHQPSRGASQDRAVSIEIRVDAPAWSLEKKDGKIRT